MSCVTSIGHLVQLVNQCGVTVMMMCCPAPLNHAKLSTGGAASLLQVRVTELPSGNSPTGKTVMEEERGPSAEKEKKQCSRVTKPLQ